jgi:membrane protease YdiL (CAAX protease family)
LAAILLLLLVIEVRDALALMAGFACFGATPWAWLVVDLWPLACAFLVFPLLGPGARRTVLGCSPSPASMRNGFLLGLFGVALFWSYRRFVLLPLSFMQSPAASTPSDLLVFALSLTLLGPFGEEVLFRGLLWSALRSVSSVPFTVVVTAAIFAMAHGPDRIRELPCLFAAGLLFGVLRHRSNSLAPSMLAHSVTNLGIITLAWW